MGAKVTLHLGATAKLRLSVPGMPTVRFQPPNDCIDPGVDVHPPEIRVECVTLDGIGGLSATEAIV